MKFGFVLWETRVKLGRAENEYRPHILGPPQRPPSPAVVKLTSKNDPSSTAQGRQAGSAATWEAQNNFWRHGDLTNLPGPWVLGAYRGEWRQGVRSREGFSQGTVPKGTRTEKGAWLVLTWILSLCESPWARDPVCLLGHSVHKYNCV